MIHKSPLSLTQLLYHAALLAMPLVGVGSVYLVSGVDTGAGFQPAYILLALAYGAQLLGEGSRQIVSVSHQHAYWVKIILAVLVVLGLSVLGLFWHPPEAPGSERFARFMRQCFQWIVMVSFTFAPLLWSSTPQAWQVVGRLLTVTLLFEFVYCGIQAVSFYHPLSFYIQMDNWFTSNPAILSGSKELFLGERFVGIPRLRGTMCEPLYLGNYLLFILPLLVLTWGRRVKGLLLIFMALLLLVLTWARGSYLAALVAGAVAGILLRRCDAGIRIWPWFLRVAVVAVVTVFAVVIISGPESLLLPWQRMLQSFHSGDWSNLTRLYAMQAAWRAFLLSPLVGVGWGQFAYHFPLLVDPMGLQSQFAWPVVGNFPLQILCETGILGFGVFLTAVVYLGRKVWQATSPFSETGRRLGPKGRIRIVATAAAVVGVWTQLLTFSQYNLPHIWVALGLLVVALGAGENRAGHETGIEAGTGTATEDGVGIPRGSTTAQPGDDEDG